MEKMIIEQIAIKKIINISMNLLFINKIKIKGIYPAIINIPLSKLHNIPNIGIKPKKNKCIKLIVLICLLLMINLKKFI